MESFASLCDALARSKLLTPDALRAVRQRWLDESPKNSAGDPARFSQWLIANGLLTDFQLGVLKRGFAELLFLDDYKLLERIGQGRMAGVYKAVHKLGQVVAVKVLPLSRGKDPELLARFQREAKMSLRLHHANCVRTFQVGVTAGGLHYIVMEYLDGNTLDDLLHHRHKLSVEEALHILVQTLHGLDQIAAAGLVHRDLKPANLMLVPAASKTALQSSVKILDIGLGRALFDENGAEETTHALTGDNVLLGTPQYMAPEQARSAHSVDIRADIYSLGCVFYQMITGQPPFPESNVVKQLVRHAKETPKPLRALVPDSPPALQAMLDKMLAKDPGERFPSPAAALQTIGKLGLAKSPAPTVEANAPMPSYVKWLKRHRASEGPVKPDLRKARLNRRQ